MLRLDFLSNDYQDTRSSVEKTTDAIAIEILTGILRPGRHLAEQQLCMVLLSHCFYFLYIRLDKGGANEC